MPRDQHHSPDPWSSTMRALAKVSGPVHSPYTKMRPGAQHQDGRGRRVEDSGIRDAHVPSELRTLLD